MHMCHGDEEERRAARERVGLGGAHERHQRRLGHGAVQRNVVLENVLKGERVGQSIIGIGLNVNQTDFMNLDKASSLQRITGRNFDLEELLHSLLGHLWLQLESIEAKTVTQLLPTYEKLLFRKDKPSTFTNAHGKMFMGFIRKALCTVRHVLQI